MFLGRNFSEISKLKRNCVIDARGARGSITLIFCTKSYCFVQSEKILKSVYIIFGIL